MKSVLEEITALRGGSPLTVDYRNSNRYRLVIQENDGSKTGYYFSAPIYNIKSGKLVDAEFQANGDVAFLNGSNASVTISDKVLLEGAEGACSLYLPQRASYISPQELRFENNSIMPTLNGVAFRCNMQTEKEKSFIFEAGEPFLEIRVNDRYFAFMKERFRPLAVVSAIGCADVFGNITAPAKIEYQKLTDKKYKLTVSAASPLAHSVLFEVNLYENKLFQDTTVESKNPAVNNAFGSIGFIGNTELYGEQWLYSRPDYSKMSELTDKRINKVVLHMPKLSRGDARFKAFNVNARFCSFGSNWGNKISEGAPISVSETGGCYQNTELTPLLVDFKTGAMATSEGFILKPEIKNAGFSAVSTGDSYLAPQILEINYI